MATSQHKSAAIPRSERQIKRSATSGRFLSGSKVKVPFGARVYMATVVEERNGRIHVSIQVPGADEAMSSSYTAEELQKVADCDTVIV